MSTKKKVIDLKICVGDTIVVDKKPITKFANVDWVSNMDEYVSKPMVVVITYDDGSFAVKGNRWIWQPRWCRILKAKGHTMNPTTMWATVNKKTGVPTMLYLSRDEARIGVRYSVGDIVTKVRVTESIK